MGNKNYQTDQIFMETYKVMHKQFIRPLMDILFDVQDIKFPLSTSGMKIVDASGRRVKLAGANWSGGHAQRHCVSGLEYRPLRQMCQQIRKKFDMNCIRLTFSLQMYYDNNVIDKQLIAANPDLIGKTSMEIFDITVEELTRAGLMVILNNHTSTSQWCCSPSDGDGLWWSQKYSQEKYFQCIKDFAKRYKDNPRVIGMDLRNQLRRMTNLLGPTWGDGNPKTDWHRAATYIGNQTLKIAPDWLIFVSGLYYQLDLTGVTQKPIKFDVPNKLVYTGHFYGFSWIGTIWKLTDYDQFRKKILNQQLFVRGLGVPFYLGQFGGNEQDIPWQYLMRILKQEDIDWTYWCLDGYKCKDKQDQTFGIWTNDYKNVRHPKMLRDIQQVGRPKKGLNMKQN